MLEALSSPACQRFTLASLHFCWQGCCIALGFRSAVARIRFRSARTRYAVALTALAVMGLCPVLTALMLEASDKPSDHRSTENPELTRSVASLEGNLPDGPRRSTEGEAGPRFSLEAGMGSRRSAEAEGGDRRPPEVKDRPRRSPEGRFGQDRRRVADQVQRADRSRIFGADSSQH